MTIRASQAGSRYAGQAVVARTRRVTGDSYPSGWSISHPARIEPQISMINRASQALLDAIALMIMDRAGA